jgi:hypothetical protein
MALQFALSGLFALFVGLGSYMFRTIRNVEDILPDHDAETAGTEQAAVPAST